MVRDFKRPILLIEFDDSIPFKLYEPWGDQEKGLGSMELSPASVISKLTLLTIHYPELTLIWSKNPENSAKILKELC